MTWAFIWLMVILKIPIIALLAIVWWALRAVPEPEPAQGSSDDGGLRRRHRHPRPTHPRHPRRGPHGTPVAAPPPRVRVTTLRGRPVEH